MTDQNANAPHPSQPELAAVDRYGLRVRWLLDGGLGVTIGGVEYGMHPREAQRLISLITERLTDAGSIYTAMIRGKLTWKEEKAQ